VQKTNGALDFKHLGGMGVANNKRIVSLNVEESPRTRKHVFLF
jgi:hypothetical protein